MLIKLSIMRKNNRLAPTADTSNSYGQPSHSYEFQLNESHRLDLMTFSLRQLTCFLFLMHIPALCPHFCLFIPSRKYVCFSSAIKAKGSFVYCNSVCPSLNYGSILLWFKQTTAKTKASRTLPCKPLLEERNQWKSWTISISSIRNILLLLLEWCACLDNWWAKSLNSVVLECAVSRYLYLSICYFDIYICIECMYTYLYFECVQME